MSRFERVAFRLVQGCIVLMVLSVPVSLYFAVHQARSGEWVSGAVSLAAAIFAVHATRRHSKQVREARRRQTANGRYWRAASYAHNPQAGGGTSTTAGTVGAGPGATGTAVGPRIVTGPWGLRFAVALPTAWANVGELEQVEGDIPILARRRANLVLSGPTPGFRSLFRGRGFGVDADAECLPRMVFDELTLNDHAAPHESCTCGFYAVPSDVLLDSYGYVTLLVELSGKVVEHERGYRAEHQRVVECQLHPCRVCGKQASVLVTERSSGMVLASACHAHVGDVTEGILLLADPATWRVTNIDLGLLADCFGVPFTLQGTAE